MSTTSTTVASAPLPSSPLPNLGRRSHSFGGAEDFASAGVPLATGSELRRSALNVDEKQQQQHHERSLSETAASIATTKMTSPSPSSIPAWLIVGTWICLSSVVILFNREIMMGSANFQYPITLTSLHLLYQTIATRLLHRYTNLIAGVSHADYAAVPLEDIESGKIQESDSRKVDQRSAKDVAVHVPWDEWWRQIVPPAIMFSLSLVLSNWAYLYLTTAFIHMLKAVSPVAILLAAFAFGTKTFSVKLLLIVIVISFGVGIASYGETSFNLTGFFIQMTAIAIEATRVTLIQILLAGKDMSPLKSLYLFAPICLCINASLILPVEGFEAIRAIPRLGFFIIFINASLTMALNLSSIYLIGISSMVLSLSKVAKDVIMVGGSALLLGDQLTLLQAVGYTIATVGMLYYKSQ